MVRIVFFLVCFCFSFQNIFLVSFWNIYINQPKKRIKWKKGLTPNKHYSLTLLRDCDFTCLTVIVPDPQVYVCNTLCFCSPWMVSDDRTPRWISIRRLRQNSGSTSASLVLPRCHAACPWQCDPLKTSRSVRLPRETFLAQSAGGQIGEAGGCPRPVAGRLGGWPWAAEGGCTWLAAGRQRRMPQGEQRTAGGR